MSCRSTPGSSACVSIASARTGLDETQVSSILHASMREASEQGFTASEDGYAKRLWVHRRELAINPGEFNGRTGSIDTRLAAGMTPENIPEDPHRRFAIMALEERCQVASHHLHGVIDRASNRIGESRETTVTRYHAYRAEAEVDNTKRAPRRFADMLARGSFTWAAPRDRVTAWALWRLAQDAGDEPRPEQP